MKVLVLLAGLAIPHQVFCQKQLETQEILDRVADHLLATAEEDFNYEELYETLTQLLANPVDLNKATREQFRAIMILNEMEINALLVYRNQQGPFVDVLELQAIPSWSEETVSRIIPFVKVADPAASVGQKLIRRMLTEGNPYVVMRYDRVLETRPGYLPQADSSQRYAGNPDRYYLRYRVSRSGDFSLGFTAEKDAGEPFQWSPATAHYGFDFYSGHLQLMNKGPLQNLMVGDYQCQFGQGLQFGSAFGLGKTAQAITGIRRSNLGFLPYVSAGENNFFRGLAATWSLAGFFRIHTFFSQKHGDGIVEGGDGTVRSIQTSGLHRTPRELFSQGQITDRDIGLVFQYRQGTLDAGLIAHRKSLSHALSPEDTPYNQFQFRGTGYSNLGGYINFSWASFTAFAEYAGTLGHGRALTVGVLGNLTAKLEMAWFFRHFGPDYYASYANAISESSTPQNEQGLYCGIKYTANRRIAVQGYLDYFRFPWLRYRVYQPSDGTEWLLRLDFKPNKTTSLFLQVREETKARNLPDEGALYAVGTGSRKNVWVNAEFELVPGLSLKSRFQASQYGLGGRTTRGMAAVEEVTWRKNRWTVTAQCALFDTDDFENRQYVYEKDVWLATSLPAYDGMGVRNYVLVHCTVTRHLDIWLRWARSVYQDRETIGTGLDQIAGNTRNDIKFQVRIRP